MRTTVLVLAGFATPALAHDGFHFHPHSGEIVLTVMIAMVGGLVLAWKRK